MSWGQELWDQYDPICTQLDRQTDFVKRVSGFVKDRIHAEQNYAKELRKLCKSYKKRDEEESKYTLTVSFSKMVSETNDLAGQRELIAEYLQSEVLKPMHELIKSTQTDRKKLMQEGAELHRSLKESMDTLDKFKRIYLKASEEKEQAAHALEKADNDPQSTKAKIDKLTQISRAKDQEGEKSRNNYILQLEATNTFRKEHYTQRMPKLMDDFMQTNTNHIRKFQELVMSFAESHRKVHPVINTCLNNITDSANAIDPDKDNRQFIGEHKTGYPVPSDVDFEEYHDKIKRKDPRKKDEKKKFEARDYSHLPPEQRKKKLLKKIADLEANYNKTSSDKTAMGKMIEIYKKNPSLGDAKQVEQQLQQTEAKLEGISTEITEFKGYLHIGQPDGDSSSITSGGSPRQSSFKSKNGKKKKEKEDKSKGTSKLAAVDISAPAVNQKSSSPAPVQRDDTWFSDDEGGSVDGATGGSGGSGVAVGGGGGGVGGGGGAAAGGSGGQLAQLLYDFQAQTEDEISCTADEEVIVLDDMGDGWLKVRKKSDNSEGFVPESYIEYV